MANLTAFFQFDYELLNLNWYVENFDAHLLDKNVFNPWDDEYVIFTDDEAVVLNGNGFKYDSSANMTKGTVEAMSEWFWDSDLLAWFQIYQVTGVAVSANDIYEAAQTPSTGDDFSLLGNILSGRDMFHLSQFDDTARGYDGADRMFGLGGNDTLMGDNGKDKLSGGSGEDLLIGGNGKDRLFGGDDNDILRGGGGKDVLRGGEGRDKIIGGDGEDLFKFKTGDGKDIVKDFEVSFLDHDRIDLSGLASVKSWNDLKNNHMSQDGDDVVIDGGDGDLLILRNVDVDNLVKMFFDF